MKKLFLILSLFATMAHCEPLKIVVSNPPGGATDVAARIFARELSAQGIDNVIINQGGASGRVALVHTLAQIPDGNTVLFTGSGLIIYKSLENPEFYSDMRRLVPIDKVAEIGYMFVTKKDSRIRTWKDLDQAVHNGAVNIGSGSVTMSSLVNEVWPNNSNAVVIMYNSDSQVMLGLLSGSIDVAMVTNVYAAQVEAGELNALAVSNTHGQFGIKSLRELGIAAERQTWLAVFAPPGTPGDLVQNLYTAFERAKASAEVQAALRPAIRSTIPKKQTPDEFYKDIELEYNRAEKTVKLKPL